MKIISQVFMICVLLLDIFPARISSAALIPADKKPDTSTSSERVGYLPLYFIKNEGQADKRVRYYQSGTGYNAFFTDEGLSLTGGGKRIQEDFTSEGARFYFPGRGKSAKVVAENPLEGKVNYLYGSDKKKWKTGISTYGSVLYKNIFSGIDVRFYNNGRDMEYDVVVQPEADPAAFRMSVSGVSGLMLKDNGDMEIVLKNGSLIHKRPVIYQIINGKRVDIQGRHRLYKSNGHKKARRTAEDEHILGFEIASYDKKHTLVIDPVIEFSTFYGGLVDDLAQGIALDNDGNAYITGYSEYVSSSDVFVAKISADGSSLIYSTFIGGGIGYSKGADIAVDAAKDVFITGHTDSPSFVVVGSPPLQAGLAGMNDAFIAKLNFDGTILLYSSYLGGTDSDMAYDVAVAPTGEAFVTGQTMSLDFPVASPLQGSFAGGIRDAFVAKINASGNGLVFSTYLGGLSDDSGMSVALDIFQNAYISGSTSSVDFPSVFPFDPVLDGSTDAFVTKMDPSGSTIFYSTFIGGSLSETAKAISVDRPHIVYITGVTDSPDYPLLAPLQAASGGLDDAFVSILDTRSGTTGLLFSTYIGGSGYDEGNDIVSSLTGYAYIAGTTDSVDFPIVNPFQATNAGLLDAFIAKIDAPGGRLVYSSYLGGSFSDAGTGVAVKPFGGPYVTGHTMSADFPTLNPLDILMEGIRDSFITKLDNILYTLDLFTAGSGSGLATPQPVSLPCGINCNTYEDGAKVTLQAVPDPGSSFAGWSGDPDCVDGTVFMDADKSCTATFIRTIPPDTNILSAPVEPSSSPDASFTFTSTDANATFECSLDGSVFSTCASPKLYTGLSDGSHTFDVMAKDLGGTLDPTPASYSWTIDTVPPAGSVVINAGEPYTNVASTVLSLSCLDEGGCKDMQFSPDGSNWTAFEVFRPTKDWILTGGDGAVTAYVRYTDSAGNSSVPFSDSIILDTVPPVVTLIEPLPNSILTSAKARYTLSENILSGAIRFVNTGGRPDPESPHLYNLSLSQLTAGGHEIDIPVQLHMDSFYSVTMDVFDVARNPAPTAQSVMVFFDQEYGAGPIGNLDNSPVSANKVDGYDLIKLAIAFGSVPGDVNWNPSCDIDKNASSNGRIDGSDLIVLGVHFGEAGQ